MSLPIQLTEHGGILEPVFGHLYIDAGSSDIVQKMWDASGTDLAAFGRAIRDQSTGGNWGEVLTQLVDGGNASSTMVDDGGNAS